MFARVNRLDFSSSMIDDEKSGPIGVVRALLPSSVEGAAAVAEPAAVAARDVVPVSFNLLPVLALGVVVVYGVVLGGGGVKRPSGRHVDAPLCSVAGARNVARQDHARGRTYVPRRRGRKRRSIRDARYVQRVRLSTGPFPPANALWGRPRKALHGVGTLGRHRALAAPVIPSQHGDPQ
jgi:hypothetical protein